MNKVAMLAIDSKSTISRFIQQGAMRPVNHNAFEYVDDELVFEALFRGIEVTKSEVWYKKHGKGTVIHRVEQEVQEDLYQFSLHDSWLAEKDNYHFAQLVTFIPFIRAVAKRFVKEADRAWICSEFAESRARQVNWNFVHKITKPSDVSPGDVLDSIRFETDTYTVIRY